MQDEKNQFVLTLLEEELDWLTDTIAGIPYSALLLEGPQTIFIAGRSQVFGYSNDEILADKWLWINMIHPADRERVFAVLSYCKNSGTPFEIEHRVIDKDGSLHWVIDEGEPVLEGDSQVTVIEGIITDVTEFRRAKYLLLEEKHFG